LPRAGGKVTLWLLEGSRRGRAFLPARQSATPRNGSDRVARQGNPAAHSRSSTRLPLRDHPRTVP